MDFEDYDPKSRFDMGCRRGCVGAIVGAIAGGVFLPWIYIELTHPNSFHDGQIGLTLFFVTPVAALAGAILGNKSRCC